MLGLFLGLVAVSIITEVISIKPLTPGCIDCICGVESTGGNPGCGGIDGDADCGEGCLMEGGTCVCGRYKIDEAYFTICCSKWIELPDEAQTCTKYGDMMTLTPTGASQATAESDNLNGKSLSPYSIKMVGVQASNQMVTADEPFFRPFKACMQGIGPKYGIHPALIAAIMSRESRAGNALDENGLGDDGRGYGLMQCDLITSGIDCRNHEPLSCEHVEQLIRERLIVDIQHLGKNEPTKSWPAERRLQGGVAAYNFGTGNVQTWGGLDTGSTNNDYSNDVMARAQFLVSLFGWNCPVANDWKNCPRNEECATKCVTSYLNCFGKDCIERINHGNRTGNGMPNPSTACAKYGGIHDGGPTGCNSPASAGFRQKVRKCCEKPAANC